jgi:hypothetical protein
VTLVLRSSLKEINRKYQRISPSYLYFFTMIAAGRVLSPMKIGRWLLCLAGLVVAFVVSTSQDKTHLSKKTNFREHVAATKSAEGRRIYPLSVISGGVYSAEELNRARKLDSVVNAHYAGFGKNPVVQQTSKDLLMYVSYRKSDAVYWTRTKRRIPKGEFILSDNSNLARARCGNRLSFTPQQPSSPDKEPVEEVLNTPEAPEILLPFDAPPPPTIEASLYVPADPLPADLLSRLSSPTAVAFPHNAVPFGASGAYLPMPGWGAGSFGTGGTPFLAGGIGSSAQANAGSGTSSSVPITVGNLVVISTPEPASARLLLLPVLIMAFFCLRERTNRGL